LRDKAVAHEFAVRLALIAFATGAIQGLANRADFEAALKLALAAAAACCVLGWLCGELARRVVEESVRRTTAAPAPIPTSTSAPQTPGR
jgi:Na+/glutamate symporter